MPWQSTIWEVGKGCTDLCAVCGFVPSTREEPLFKLSTTLPTCTACLTILAGCETLQGTSWHPMQGANLILQ